jgi:hypothetical protein
LKLSLQNNMTLWISLLSIVVLSHHKVTYQLELSTCMENIYDYFSMWFVWSQLEFLGPTPWKQKHTTRVGMGVTQVMVGNPRSNYFKSPNKVQTENTLFHAFFVWWTCGSHRKMSIVGFYKYVYRYTHT